MEGEQRQNERARVWLPIRLALPTGEVLAVSCNASEMGALILVGQAVAVGTRVMLTFDVPGDPPTSFTVGGQVVRVEPNAEDPNGLWPERLGVTFDEPVIGLGPDALAPLSRRSGR